MHRAFIGIAVACFGLVFASLALNFTERTSLTPLAESYVKLVPQELGAPNVITGILLTYRAFDTLRPDASLRSTRPGDRPFNDLDLAAFDVEPRLGEVRDQCVEATGRDVHLTGSGAALFLLADSADDARSLASAIHARLTLPALPVHTL